MLAFLALQLTRNRAVTHARNDQYRPVVFRNGSRVDLEDVLAEGKTRSPSASNSEDPPGAKMSAVGLQSPSPRKLWTRTTTRAITRSMRRRTESVLPTRKALRKPMTAKDVCGVCWGGAHGLEDAIRLSLCALQERLAQSSASELPLSPPPGLAPSVSAPVESAPALSSVPELPQAQEQDVMQLLNLRGMLLDRLLQKEDNVQAYSQATLMAMQQMQEQQYMQQMQQTPPMCPMPNPYMPYATMDSKWEETSTKELEIIAWLCQDGNVTNIPTPRTNKLMLESSLGSF
eukprot:s3481_g4.t1